MRNVSNNRGDTPRPGNGRSIDYLQRMVCLRGYLSLPLQEFIFLYTIPFRSNAELFLRRIVTRDPHFDGSTNTSTTVLQTTLSNGIMTETILALQHCGRDGKGVDK